MSCGGHSKTTAVPPLVGTLKQVTKESHPEKNGFCLDLSKEGGVMIKSKHFAGLKELEKDRARAR